MRIRTATGRLGERLTIQEPAGHLVVRLIAAVCVIVLGIVGVIDAFLAIAGLIAVAVGDVNRPLSLKNYFLAYLLAIFGLGGLYFAHGDTTLSIDALFYVCIFLVGHFLVSRAPFAARLSKNGGRTAVELTLALRLLAVVLAGWIVLLVGQLVAYGVSGFYSGQALAERIARYGHADFVTGLMSVFEQGLAIVTVATAAYYLDLCVRRRTQPSYWLLGLIFLVVPVLLLRRSDNALGTLFLLAVQPVVAGLSGYRYSLRAAGPLIIASLVLSLASSVVIGSIRESAVGPPPPTPLPTLAVPTGAFPTVERATAEPATVVASQPAPAPRPLVTIERTDRLFRGELSPIVAYRDIRENQSDFGYQFGGTILPPLALKVVPRSWLPEKPISSSALYMGLRDPGALAAGYLLPVTVFGDALLNFGYAGALAAVLILGLVAGRLDRVTRASSARDLPVFLIVYYNFYGLMRNDLANSLAVIFLSICVFGLLRHSEEAMLLVGRVRAWGPRLRLQKW